ncbi:hypothetical protein FPV67DRAFT_1453378 [Lyophyllum atratum]|nr:hypothetical protein FPV67DRAFT_1453378 [Lyophyllum atratum]
MRQQRQSMLQWLTTVHCPTQPSVVDVLYASITIGAFLASFWPVFRTCQPPHLVDPCRAEVQRHPDMPHFDIAPRILIKFSNTSLIATYADSSVLGSREQNEPRQPLSSVAAHQRHIRPTRERDGVPFIVAWATSYRISFRFPSVFKELNLWGVSVFILWSPDTNTWLATIRSRSFCCYFGKILPASDPSASSCILDSIRGVSGLGDMGTSSAQMPAESKPGQHCAPPIDDSSSDMNSADDPFAAEPVGPDGTPSSTVQPEIWTFLHPTHQAGGFIL